MESFHADLRDAAVDERAGQVARTIKGLYGFGKGLDYPFTALAEAFHPIQPGEIDILAAFTGSGKSTAVRSFCFGWLANSSPVIYGGFEMGSEKSQMAFAATSLGFDPGPILSGRYESDPDFRETFKAIEAEVKAMTDSGSPWRNLHLTEHRVVTPRAVEEMGNLAVALEKEAIAPAVIVVDHLDHLATNRKPYDASREVCEAMLNHAKTYGTRWVCTSQLNREGNKTGDPFWRHRPVQEQMILHGSTKAQIATRVFGVYRPLKSDATADELKAVRDGKADMKTVVSQNQTAFNLIKHRWTGAAGTRLLLGWEKGRLVDLPTPDQLAVESRQHGIRTSYGY